MDDSEQGQDEEQSNDQSLKILKRYWTRHVQESILSTWMNTDKQNFSQAECKVINDMFVESFELIQSLNSNNGSEFTIFLQKINTIWTLIHKYS